MYRLLLPLLSILGLLVNSALGELNVTSSSAKAMTQLVTPEIISTNLVLVGEGSSLSFTDIAIINVKTSAETVLIKARTKLFESVELRRNPKNEWQWFLSGVGTYEVSVVSYTVGLGYEDKTIQVIVGPSVPPPPPTPIPPPGPPVPPDAFNNVGQQIVAISASLPRRMEVASIYATASVKLRGDPSATINSIADEIVNNRTKLLGLESAKYADVMLIIKKEQDAHWPMGRTTYADFLGCIAKGINPALTCESGVCK